MLLFSSCSKEFLNNCDDKSTAYKNLKASFTAQTDGFKVVFTNKSENAESYLWDFGDGSISKEVNPSKTFNTTKAYTVKLTATRCGGELTTATTQVIDVKCNTILPPTLVASTKEVCNGEKVTLTATGCSNGLITWSNGITGTSFSQNLMADLSVSAVCSQGVCKSINSNTVNVSVIPTANIITEKAVVSGILLSFDITFKGIIDFKTTILNNGLVNDYGFVWTTSNTTPTLSLNTGKKSFGIRKEAEGVAFSHDIIKQITNQLTYRAYIETCSGEIVYGNTQKIN